MSHKQKYCSPEHGRAAQNARANAQSGKAKVSKSTKSGPTQRHMDLAYDQAVLLGRFLGSRDVALSSQDAHQTALAALDRYEAWCESHRAEADRIGYDIGFDQGNREDCAADRAALQAHGGSTVTLPHA